MSSRNRSRVLGIALVASALLASAPADRTILPSTHERMNLERDVARLAVGDPGIVEAQLLDSRQVLLLGRRIGRTSLILWYADGGVEEIRLNVQRDLSVLAAALRDIYPGIRLESAPDRDAIVLRGTVPDISFSRAAETAARDYLGAGRREASAQPVVRVEPDAGAPEDAAGGAGDQASADRAALEEVVAIAQIEATPSPSVAVINLIRVTTLPESMEQKLRRAIAPAGGAAVRVRRVVHGAVPDDQVDTFVLEGRVADQIVLVRVLSLAARVVSGRTDGAAGIRVLADEAGGLGTGGGGGGASASSGIASTLSAGSVLGRSGGLSNALGTNVARASMLEAANGRVLSLLTVDDLPQVRVDAQIYEVNRTKLRSYTPQLDVLLSDFGQAPLLPPAAAVDLQGRNAPRVGAGSGQVDVENALSMIGGALFNQFQLTGSRIALQMIFSLLEQEGIARSLSRPAVSVLSGETASFQVGGEIPVTVAFTPSGVDDSGSLPEGVFNSVVFVPFGVQLAIRPLVGEGDVITLDVTPDIVTPDPDLTAQLRQSTGQTQASTAFESRSLTTTARLEDGQALMVGGLLSRSLSDDRGYTPWLHNVPGVGWLAKSFDVQDEELEVVILVSPAIVRAPIPAAHLWEFPEPVVGAGFSPLVPAENSEASTGTIQ